MSKEKEQKKSTRSKVVERILKIAGSKKRFINVENSQKYLSKCRKQNRKIYKIPKLYKDLANLSFF